MRRTLSILLALLLCLSLLPTGALASEEFEGEISGEQEVTLEIDELEDVTDIEDSAEEDVLAQFPEDEAVEDIEAYIETEEELPALDGETITVTVGDYEYKITDGNAVLNKYNGRASSVTLPTSLNYNGTNYKVRSVEAYAFEGNTSLKTLIIPDGIMKLGNGVFKNCTNLSSVTINGNIDDCGERSKGDYNWENISVFYNAGANTDTLTVTFGAEVTRIPAYLFATGSSKGDGYYAHITKVTISDSVTEIGAYAFYNCYDLAETSWGKNLSEIGSYAFANVTAMKTLSLPGKVSKIGEKVFEACTGLISITLPSSTASVGNGAFKNCTKLSSITINGNIADCGERSKGDYNWENISVFYNAGANTDALTVTFGAEVTRIPAYLFATGSSKADGFFAHITKVTISGSVTEIGAYAFYNCYDLAEVNWGKNLSEIGGYAFANVTAMKTLSLPGKVSKIGEKAFEACTGLTSINLPSSTASVGNGAFKNCTNLSSLTINGNIADCGERSKGDYNWENISVFYNAGANTDTLTVTFGAEVTRIPAYLFATGSSKGDGYYAHITKVTFSGSVTVIGAYAFYNCYDLAEVNWGENLSEIGSYAFANVTAMKTLSLPGKLSKIGEKVFEACTGLTSITLPGSTTSVGNGAFKNCTKLSSLTINGNIADCGERSKGDYNWENISVFYSVGANTNGLTVTFGEGVTRIPAYLFATGSTKADGYYAHVTKVIIPKSVTEIGKYAFYNCHDLKEVEYAGTDFSTIKTGENNDSLTSAKLTYKSTDTYTVTFNSQGGTAVSSRTVTSGGTIDPLPTTTREGYTFDGWYTAASGGTKLTTSTKITSNKTYYAHWTQIPTPSGAQLVVSNATAAPGSEVTVTVSLKDNPGIAYLGFKLSYDTSKLQFVNAAGDGLTGWTETLSSGGSAVWYSDKNSTYNGSVLKLTFKVLSSVSSGTANISLTNISAFNATDNAVSITATAGTVTISSRLPGDVNGDGQVDGRDIIRLAQYFAGYNVTINSANANVNGDSTLDGRDIIRLAQYFAGYNVELK